MKVILMRSGHRSPAARTLWARLCIATSVACALVACKPKVVVIGAGTEKSTKDYSLKETIEKVQGLAGEIDVSVERLEPRAIKEVLTDVIGELAPVRSMVLRPRMDGQLHFLRELKVGGRVKKGEMLAKIDDRDLLDEIQLQDQEIEIARKRVRLEEITLEQKKETLGFDRNLAKKGYVTAVELARSELDVETAKVTLQQANITLDQELGRQKKRLREREKVHVVAPFDGMIVQADHLTGEQTSADLYRNEVMDLEGTIVGPSTALFGIVSEEGFYAQCLLSGQDRAKLEIGQRAEVIVHSHRPVLVTGRIVKISAVPDAQSHGYKFWIELDESDETFSSGMFVRADIELAHHEQALVVERRFVKQRGTQSFVQLVRDGVVTNADVQLGLRRGPMVEIVSGVKIGDLVIRAEEEFVRDQRVNAVVLIGKPTPSGAVRER